MSTNPTADRRVTIYLIIIGCLLFGLFTGRPFFFSIAYVLGALVLAALVWSWVAASSVKIARTTRNRRAQVGRTLDEQFIVTNTGWLPKLWLEVRDHSTLPAHAASRVAPFLWREKPYSWKVNTVCSVRGEFLLGPLTLSSGDPFGLFHARKQIAATSTILVYPMTVRVYEFVAPLGRLSGGDARRQPVPFVTSHAAGVREYAPGDSLNRVHWKSSARHNKLIVKKFEIDPQADSWVILDLSATATYARPYTMTGQEPEGYIPPASEEYAVVIAASLMEYFLQKERMTGFLCYGSTRTLIPPDRGYRQSAKVLELLANVHNTGQTSLKEVLALESHSFTRGATVAIITADMSAAWTEEAHRMARRGLRVAAVLLDPLSFGGVVMPLVGEQATILAGSGVAPYVVRNGDQLSLALSTPAIHLR
jgi:uncharacterized protein (DUF58 family)